MGGFIAGLLIGAAGGMFVMAMANAANNRRRSDDETAWYDQGYIDGWNDCSDTGGDFTKRKPWRRDD